MPKINSKSRTLLAYLRHLYKRVNASTVVTANTKQLGKFMNHVSDMSIQRKIIDPLSGGK